jgi:hypothetical protein
MKKYIFRKPPYPIDPVCEKIKKRFLPEKVGVEVSIKFYFVHNFYDMILSDFEKSGNFQEHEP